MPVRMLRTVAVYALAIVLAGCHTSSRNQSPPDAPLPGGNPPPPSTSWYSRFLGLDKKPDTRPNRKSSDADPTIDPFLPNVNPNPGGTASTGIRSVSLAKQTLDVSIQTAPSSSLGQEVPVRIVAQNRGANPTGPFSISQPVPDSVQLLRSDPPATLQGNRLVWNLPSMNAGDSQNVTVVYRPARAGLVSLRAEAANRDQALGAANFGLDVMGAGGIGIRQAPPQLALQVVGPNQARQGDRVSMNVNVTNAGSVAVENVLLLAELDSGLEHESGARKLEIPIPSMAAGESKSVQLPLTVRGTGRQRVIVSAISSGGTARQECVVDVQDSRIEVAMTGPATVQMNQPGTWVVRVANTGTAALDGATVRVQVPPELTYKGSSADSQLDRNTVVWSLGRLGAHESRNLEMTATGHQLGERASLVATATADRTPESRSDLTFEVLGKPVLQLSARGSDEAVAQGGRIIYAIEVRNSGTLPVRDVNLWVDCSTHLKPLFAAGPTITRIDGQRVVCSRIAEIAPGQGLVLRLEAEAASVGDAQIKVEAQATMPSEPVRQELITRIVSSLAQSDY